MSARYKERLTRLESVLLLEKPEIDFSELRASCSYGIPEAFRPLCWRLLLDYLPAERALWPTYLKKQRETYNALVEDIILQPGELCGDDSSFIKDHPLSLNPDSEWRKYFKDNEILIQIDKDVRRLYPEIEFFQRTTDHPHRSAAKVSLSKRIRQENLHSEIYDNTYSRIRDGNFLTKSSKVLPAEYVDDTGDASTEYHWQVVERILFIYSKLNPGVKYVQGMNEIVGPLYFVLASDGDAEWSEFAEADTYFCFQLLMSEIKDNFIKTLDTSNCGIEWTMAQFHERMRCCDPDLHQHLVVDLCIKPQFYAFRWLSLLLSQEFPLPDVITVWDSLFASESRLDFLQWVCLAMLQKEREVLMKSDFSGCLRLLQNYPETDVGQLVTLAHELGDNRHYRQPTMKSREEKPALTPASKIAAAFSNAMKNLAKK